MRLLFEIDKKDYDPNGKVFSRPSARAIIFKDDKVAVIYSRQNKYCKIPGGGIENNEDKVTAMIREVKEEAGLTVKPETIKEFGYVHRIQKGNHDPVFVQDNFYYICNVEDKIENTEYTEKEKKEDFIPLFLTLDEVIKINQDYIDKSSVDNFDKTMIERELKVLQIVKKEI